MPLRFYLHTKTYADGRRPIYADVRWGRLDVGGSVQEARLRTSTGQSCQPANWNDTRQRVKSGETGYAKANNKLAALETEIGNIIDRAELDKEALTPALLLERLKPGKVRKKDTAPSDTVEAPTAAVPVRTMLTLLADWQEAHRGRRAAKTLTGPKGLVDQLERFRPGIRPEELQPDAHGRCRVFEEFCVYCMEEATNRTGTVGLLNNTISSYVKRLRKLLKFGRYEYEWLEDEYAEEIQRHPLTYAEVEQLYQHPVEEWREGGNKHAARAGIRDVFVFICRTGPRYSSLAEIGPDALVWEYVEEIGAEVPILEYYAYKSRRKKEKLRVPLDEVALQIWKRYEGSLPVPSLGKFNEEIKLLCREAGLKRVVKEIRGSGAKRIEERVPLWQTVSAHIGRYTFITTQHKGGADLASIQDTVGHADINTTRKYTKIVEEDRLNTTISAFAKLRNRGTNQ